MTFGIYYICFSIEFETLLCFLQNDNFFCWNNKRFFRFFQNEKKVELKTNTTASIFLFNYFADMLFQENNLDQSRVPESLSIYHNCYNKSKKSHILDNYGKLAEKPLHSILFGDWWNVLYKSFEGKNLQTDSSFGNIPSMRLF